MPLLLFLLFLGLPIWGIAQGPNPNNYYEVQLKNSPLYDLSEAKIELQVYHNYSAVSSSIDPYWELHEDILTISAFTSYYNTLTLYLICPNQQTQTLDSLCIVFLPSFVTNRIFRIKTFPFQEGTYIPIFKPKGIPIDLVTSICEISFTESIAMKTPLQEKLDTTKSEKIITQYLKYKTATMGKFHIFVAPPKEQPIDAIDTEELILYENGTFLYLRTVPHIDHSYNYYSVGTWRDQGKYLILRSSSRTKSQWQHKKLGYYNDFSFYILKRQGQQLIPLQSSMPPACFPTRILKKES